MSTDRQSLGAKACLLTTVILWSTLFAKSWLSVDESFDSWWYHLPFAARLVGICSAADYEMSPWLESCYRGFPLVVECLQGFFWKLSGRPEAANLVTCLALFFLACASAKKLRIPLLLPSLCFLCVPLIQLHATRCHADLFAAVTLSAFLWGVFQVIHRKMDSELELATYFLCAILAANSKVFAAPFVGLGLFVLLGIGLRSGWSRVVTGGNLLLPTAIVLVGCASLGTYIKNAAYLGNPVYPVRLRLLGNELPGTFSTSDIPSKGYLDRLPKPLQWCLSITDADLIGRGRVSLRLWPYTIDMAVGDHGSGWRTGGFCGPLVVSHLVLFCWLIRSRYRREPGPALVSASFFTVVSLACAFLPQCYELRYSLFWILFLILANLTLVQVQSHARETNTRLLQAHGILFLVLLIWSHLAAFRSFHWSKSPFVSFQAFRRHYIATEVEELVARSNKRVVLKGFTPYAFLYADCFHEHPERVEVRLKALDATDEHVLPGPDYELVDAAVTKKEL